MQYYILRRMKLFGQYEYDTEPKARRGYTDLGEVAKKVVALENLNDSDNVKYIVVSDSATPKEQGLTAMGYYAIISHKQTERKICFI